jgi:hypothetical protein
MYVRFEVLTAVSMNNAVLCDVAPCGFTINRCFGRMCRLHLPDRMKDSSYEKC